MSISASTYNKELLENIRHSKSSRDRAIHQLYYDETLRAHFKKMMGSIHYDVNEFEPIYNHALMQFVNTVLKRKDFTLEQAYYSYITVIGRNAYVRKLKRRNVLVEPDQYVNVWTTEEEPEKLLIDLEQKSILQDLLGKLGEKCREVLLLWGNGFSMKEIAERLDYKSDGMARKKKYKCLRAFNVMIQDNPSYKKLLLR